MAPSAKVDVGVLRSSRSWGEGEERGHVAKVETPQVMY